MQYYYENDLVKIINANCVDSLPSIRDVSSVVTDPPYELGFMGKAWDSRGVSFNKEIWSVIKDSCKPGAMMLSFGGTRTFHRIAVAIEDAGWEFRDTIMWLYGSGFPKSLDISKAIDKQAGAEREVVGQVVRGDVEKAKTSGVTMAAADANKNNKSIFGYGIENITAPSTPEAKLWDGYGTALKPAFEPILVCMNPLDGTFANNALKHGVAGINIDGCRVEYGDESDKRIGTDALAGGSKQSLYGDYSNVKDKNIQMYKSKGRFPANVIHDGSQMVLDLFPQNAGAFAPVKKLNRPNNVYGKYETFGDNGASYRGDNGSAARFFYCAKSSKSERNRGCEELENGECGRNQSSFDGGKILTGSGNERSNLKQNNHPTVKPLALMEYLCKLVKMPEYNLILDPFCGSGTTLLACIRLGIPCIGIELDEHSCEIASKRCEYEFKELKR